MLKFLCYNGDQDNDLIFCQSGLDNNFKYIDWCYRQNFCVTQNISNGGGCCYDSQWRAVLNVPRQLNIYSDFFSKNNAYHERS